MHKTIWDFEIQTDHLILARQPDQVIIRKRERERERGRERERDNLQYNGLHRPSELLSKNLTKEGQALGPC